MNNENKDYDKFTPRVEYSLKGCHKDAITSISFCPTQNILVNRHARYGNQKVRSSQLASASLDGTVTLWNFFDHPLDTRDPAEQDKKKAHSNSVRPIKLVGHTGPVHCACYSAKGDVLASSSSDRTVRLWTPNIDGGSIVLKGHTAPVRCVAFGNDTSSSASYIQLKVFSSLLITASDDKTAKIWSLPSKRFLCSFPGHHHYVRAATFSPDSCLAATGSDDRTMRLWDVQRGNGSNSTCLTTFHDYEGRVNAVQFHRSGTCLASGSADHSVRMYDIRSNKLIQLYTTMQSRNLTSHSEEEGGVSSLSFHPSGNYLITCSSSSYSIGSRCSSGNNVHIWDLREGRLLHSIHGAHVTPQDQEGVQRCSTNTTSGCAAFSVDGSHFATGGVDSQLLLWGDQLQRLFGGDQSCWTERARAAVSVKAASSLERQARNPVVHHTNQRPVSAPSISDSHVVSSEKEVNLCHVPNSPIPSISVVEVQTSLELSRMLERTFDRITTQLDLLTETLAVFEVRLSAQEEKLDKLTKASHLSYHQKDS